MKLKNQLRTRKWVILLLPLFLMLFLSCEKTIDYTVPIPTVGFIQSNYTIAASDTIGKYVFAEIEGSEFVESYAYPVYFQMGGTAILPTNFTTLHTTYTALDGTVYYTTTMSQGIRKCAVSVKPVDLATGDKTITLTLFPDQQGERYKLDPARSTATFTITDNTKKK
ncbi:MAG: hypothetical protein M1445_17185 [Bacteroidetes bacterium]|nr:hypothetical protein [Bacteroidota bacterium]